MHDITDPILSEEELAKWLDTSRPTLQRQRSDGSGPPFVQLSERRIGYRKSVIEQWLEARTITRVGALALANKAAEPAVTATVTCNASDTTDPNAAALGRAPMGAQREYCHTAHSSRCSPMWLRKQGQKRSPATSTGNEDKQNRGGMKNNVKS